MEEGCVMGEGWQFDWATEWKKTRDDASISQGVRCSIYLYRDVSGLDTHPFC